MSRSFNSGIYHRYAVLQLFLLSLIFGTQTFGQTYIPGDTYFGDENYIEYKAGNLPIIISAAHGGGLEPSTIPDRNCTGCVYVKDAFTEELIRNMYDAIVDVFDCYPHVIINRLHRKKLDANRDIDEAADGNPIAENAWEEFQNFIELAKDSVEASYGKGLYIDLHGHGHDIQRLELGYRITKSALQEDDEMINMPANVNLASIKNLVVDNLMGLNLADLLRGQYSFGQMYEQKNYPAVPSFNDPYPENPDPYFRGGYNTERHGSRNDGAIDAIQIECNREGVRNTNAERQAFAEATAMVLKDYLETHYFSISSPATICDLISSTNNESRSTNNFVNVFPNPTSGNMSFLYTADHFNPFQVVIYNELGIEIRNFWFDSEDVNTFNIESLPAGVYHLLVRSSHFVNVQRIIKY